MKAKKVATNTKKSEQVDYVETPKLRLRFSLNSLTSKPTSKR
ncbi:hypothetical protein SynBIOSE41_00771 [Synechococcus sp. BIOS-E4-1]|nr:hypothetical protein SynBIOSE41_00771 [Synechococcus sp. BIOS-E4-1]